MTWPAQQLEVHVAGDLAVPLGELMEGAVEHAELAVALEGRVPRVAQHLDQRLATRGVAAARGPPARLCAELHPALPSGMRQGFTRVDAKGGVQRGGEQVGRDLVAPLGQGGPQLTTRRAVELCRPAGSRPAASRATAVLGVQQPRRHQAIEVVRSQRTTNANRGGSIVPADGDRLGKHMPVQPATHRIGKDLQVLQSARSGVVEHGVILSRASVSARLDIRPWALYN